VVKNDENMYKLHFPVITFSGGIIELLNNYSDLTTCKKVALRNGHYHNMKIVDSLLRKFTIRDAKKIKGVGFLRGYNIFLEQTIEVKLNFDSAIIDLDIELLKRDILNSKASFALMFSGGNVKQSMKQIKEAYSFDEIINILRALRIGGELIK
jgi:hypothetical protein